MKCSVYTLHAVNPGRVRGPLGRQQGRVRDGVTPGQGHHPTAVLIGHRPGHHVRRLQHQHVVLAAHGLRHHYDVTVLLLRARRLVHHSPPLFHHHHVRLVLLRKSVTNQTVARPRAVCLCKHNPLSLHIFKTALNGYR